MKNICFFSGDITRSGGTERVSTMIANGLVRMGRYRILFLSLIEAAENPFFALDEKIVRYALGKKWINPGPGYLKVLPKLRRFLKEQEIDIIIDIDIVLDSLSILAAKGLKTKIISWEHFSAEYEMESFYRRHILKYSVKHTDYVVTLTDSSRKYYMENLNRKHHISVVFNPVQEIDYVNTSQKEKWLVTVGRLIHIKGMDYLGEVAVKVLKKFPGWKWMVVGDGEERTYLERIIEDNGLQEQLILTGRVNDVNSYLEKARVYVMTSRSEGLPMCLLEAKTFRLPSISFHIAGVDDIIEDGVNGYLIQAFDCQEMAEKLSRLIEDESLWKSFSDNAWNDLSKFQIKSILEQWNMILEQLL